jgi:DNA-directed RNA polymerase subunit L
MMKITANHKGSRDIEVIVEGEDHSIAHIVRNELVGTEGIVFAGVTSTHPLLKRDAIRVVTGGKKPDKLLIEGAEKAALHVREIREELESALSKA